LNTIACLRRFINALDDCQVFTSADVSHCGKRSAIDMALTRLVRKGLITRLANGVYMKGDEFDQRPMAVEVAQIKAKRFGKTLFLDTSDIVKSSNSSTETDSEQTVVFTIDGYSSSFKYGKTKVVLQSKNCKRRAKT